MHRFAGRRQQVFIEPLGWQTPTVYLAGVSTSLPGKSRKALGHHPGSGEARITAFGYAIEYDSLEWGQLGSTLQIKDRTGCSAGQINGTPDMKKLKSRGS